MDKKRLSKYTKLQAEIAILTGWIAEAEINATAAFDTVQSGAEFPYSVKPVVVKGVSTKELQRLTTRKAAKEAECKAIEDFVASVEDSTMWLMLTQRYIKGLPLKQVAELVGYSTEYTSRRISGYLSESCQLMSTHIN